MYRVRKYDVCSCSGGDPGIRTLGGMTLAGFQDRYIRPTLSDLHVSVNSKTVEVPPGFEPGIAALQAAALPLGDGTVSDGGARSRT